MKITCNEPEQFRKKTFRELDFIQRHPPAEWNPVAFSLGDSVIHSENLDERFIILANIIFGLITEYISG